MRNESGKSRVTLIFLTILVIIGTSVIVKYAKEMIEHSQEQDLRTNMLLIQAETKKGLEEVCFRTVNIDSTKEENIEKINEIKNEYLKGTLLKNSPEEVQDATKNISEFEIDDSCYYLDISTLNEIGIKEIDEEKWGYFIVKYDFSNVTVEVVNTKGIDEKNTLTKLVEDIDDTEF